MMTGDFEVIEKALGPVVEIEERVSAWRMPLTFTRDYKRIGNYLAEHGADCVDMPYARYLDMDWEVELNRGKLATIFMLFTKKWHFYAGMPSSRLVPGEGDIKSRTLAGQRYIRGVHRGPYEECTSTYRALYDWARSQNLSLQNEAIECYVNDPREVDKADIETVILIPLA
jgi:hypothetical protein